MPPFLLIVFSLFVILRFTNLSLVPIISDEAEHLYFADKIAKNLNNIFISFNANTPYPFMVWVLALIKLTVGSFVDPLTSGRFLAVSGDMISALVIFLIGKKFFDRGVGIFSSLVYIALPLNFLHSRFVILESMANMFALIVIYFIILILGKPPKESIPVKYYLLTSAFFVLAFFTKTISLVTIFPVIFLPVIFSLKDGRFEFDTEKLRICYKRLILSLTGGIIFCLSVVAPLFNKYTTMVNTTFDINSAFFNLFKLQLHKTVIWLGSYLTVPLLVTVFLIASFSVVFKRWKMFYIALWFFSICIINSIFSKYYFPRHIFALASPAALLLGAGTYLICKRNKFFPAVLITAIISFLLIKDIAIVTSPLSILVGEDRQQFYETWVSGANLDKIAENLRNLSRDKQINVYYEQNVLISWALPNLYNTGNALFIPDNNILLNRSKFYQNLKQKSPDKETYIIISRDPFIPADWKVRLMVAYPRGPYSDIKLYKYME